jgi:hypothetical protein
MTHLSIQDTSRLVIQAILPLRSYKWIWLEEEIQKLRTSHASKEAKLSFKNNSLRLNLLLEWGINDRSDILDLSSIYMRQVGMSINRTSSSVKFRFQDMMRWLKRRERHIQLQMRLQVPWNKFWVFIINLKIRVIVCTTPKRPFVINKATRRRS